MDKREALVAELSTAPEAIVNQTYDFFRFLKSTAPVAVDPAAVVNRPKVEFAEVRRSIFGDRQVADSAPIFEDMRADRF